ncbi:unnamed protein product [Clonostachys solani]|uniref:Uncharacterized protein n=1 Tax=Clonostachys solani TaxID=160281 RepID=A0A9N9ZPC7_9HYPO|nr:unnamed protein product [Clonostachys solani]
MTVIVKSEKQPAQSSVAPAQGLQVLAATFGGVNVTEKIRELIQDDDSMTFRMNQMVHYLAPDPLPNWVKTLTILYRFDDGPLSLFNATEQHSRTVQISRVTAPIMAIQQSEDGLKQGPFADVEILAVVYGKKRIQTPSVLADLARFFTHEEQRSQIRMVNSFFKEDTWPNTWKSWTIFFKFTDSKRIQCVTGLENGALELPWSRRD